ncbi:hypothetical protein HPB49_024328 [Dermacentor silvarum]|uniref:Uncharacterized protein n=1 Tax=Dermacentor silvarum TaxID=543639 RepID=A0ACB8CN40_DERSI|nr:hypothetical protein HPB49_024328 [Dermacentor silvarum]
MAAMANGQSNNKAGANRVYFALKDDVALLTEVQTSDPFRHSEQWEEIAWRLRDILKKPFTARCVRERLNLLLSRYSANDRRNQKKKSMLRTVPHQFGLPASPHSVFKLIQGGHQFRPKSGPTTSARLIKRLRVASLSAHAELNKGGTLTASTKKTTPHTKRAHTPQGSARQGYSEGFNTNDANTAKTLIQRFGLTWMLVAVIAAATARWR